MIVKRVTLTHCRVPLVEPFRISSGAVAEKDGIVVRIETEDCVGFGESSPMSGSFYSSDTPESCWRDLIDSLIPSVLHAEFASPLDAARHVGTLPGSNFAKVGLETALWDIEAQRQGKPLYDLLASTRWGAGPRPAAVASTASPQGGPGDTPQAGGLPPTVAIESGLAVGLYDDPRDMLRAIEHHATAGYKRVKIKIERGRDIELVRAVRRTFGDIPLFVDANGAYDLSDLDTFRALDEFGLMMFEQPFAGGMLREMAQLQSQVRTPVCLDESLETEENLRDAIALGSFKIANIKIQRVGGFGPALSIYETCREHDIPVWVGTMPELGIGQAQGMHLATLPHCTYPTDVEASLRWFRDDIIDPLLEVRDGCLHPTDAPGLGFHISERKLTQYAVASETVE